MNGLSEVQRKAPFGTNYTPSFRLKIVGSKYKKVEDFDSSSPRKPLTPPQINYDTNVSLNPRPVLPPILSEKERIYSFSELKSLLPIGIDLPNKPLILGSSERISLLNLIKQEISNTPDFINNVKRVYLMLTKIDLNLTGTCSFKEFVEACYENDIHLAWDLFRIIASMFLVSSREGVGFVQYEKILSYLGAVYNTVNYEITARRNQTPRESYKNPADQSLYFQNANYVDFSEKDHNQEISVPVDELQLIKFVNEDIGSRSIPIQEIRLGCQRADSFHRGTLSAKQLENICIIKGVHFSRNTFDRILQRCKYMGGGQFKWQTFIDFLEKVQPINTGLQIPNSKMPADYFRTIPSPASSWPHAESSGIHRDITDSNIDHLRQNINLQDFCQQYSPNPEGSDHAILNNNNNSQKLSTRNYTNTFVNSPSMITEEPWLNKFLKFADSVYLRDVNSQGILFTKELFETTSMLNQQLGLNFTTTEIINALDESAADHDHIYTNINSFLKRLSLRFNR